MWHCLSIHDIQCQLSHPQLKKVVTYPNNKPWATQSVINNKKQIYYTGRPLERKKVSREVCSEIRKAKIKSKEKIEMQIAVADSERPG